MREISIVLVIHLSLASSLSPPIATNNLLVECISLFYSASYKEDCSKNLDFLSVSWTRNKLNFQLENFRLIFLLNEKRSRRENRAF